MSILSRLFRAKLGELVTCLVTFEGSDWRVVWVSDGKTPAGFGADDLGAAVDRADREVAAIYVDRPERETANLQYAIYPWSGSTAEVILDVRSGLTGLEARDIRGSTALVGAPDLAALVENATSVLPDPSRAMLRWIKAVRELPLPV